MVVNLGPKLEAALDLQARQKGIAPEDLILDILQHQLLPKCCIVEPCDDWEKNLFGAALDCGVSVPASALTSNGLYE
ncbi:MAG: hypothetical protein NT142_14220 [Planctomycetota bacterium]|nr:hypothetical protein [Planctomycetota bacterium]